MDALSMRIERRRRPVAAVALALVVTLASCGNSRESRQGEDTVPRIEPTAGPTTSAAVTVASTPSTVAATGSATSAPTSPATPFPTSATQPPVTQPPATQPPVTQPPATQPPVTQPPATQPPATQPPVTQPPVTQPPVTQAPVTQPPATQPPTTPPPITVPPTQPPVTQPPTTPPPITVPPNPPTPPTTVVVTPGDRPLCTDAAVGSDTGQLTVSDVSCHAGWAIAHDVTCPATQACEGVDVFHVTSSGWVHDGYYPATCAEGLTGSGMSVYTAATFVPTFCEGDPGPTEIIRPDSTGERVVQLQTALIGEGYPIAADGTYGPRTQAAVRDFQAQHGLEVDGIAGPRTQAALGIGPGGAPPPADTTTTATTTTAPATPGTVPTTTAPATSTTVAGRGPAVECAAQAVAADIGRQVDEITACHAGWALGQIRSCPASSACPKADLFRVGEDGWALIRSVRYRCAEDLHEAGMSAYTAGDFAPWCGVPNLPAERLVIAPGSRGLVVEQLQVALVALGYQIAIDATYGPGTEQAVRDVQQRNGLEVDGIAGPATRELLGL